MTAVIIDAGATVIDHQTAGGMHSRGYTEQRPQLSGEAWCADKHARRMVSRSAGCCFKSMWNDVANNRVVDHPIYRGRGLFLMENPTPLCARSSADSALRQRCNDSIRRIYRAIKILKDFEDCGVMCRVVTGARILDDSDGKILIGEFARGLGDATIRDDAGYRHVIAA